MQTNPSICLVVGDNGTQHCGVKDNAIRLAEALEKIGLSAQVLAPRDWGMKSFLKFCEELRKRQFDIVNVLYPSIGNRGSLGPHFMGMMRVAKGLVVTLHEYSALPNVQRASTHLFGWSADYLVFTDEAELIKYGRPGIKQRVIHIGSNVPTFPSALQRTPTVLYFGQIRPEKGIEAFLELARRSQQLAKPFNYKVIGSVPERRAAYYNALRTDAPPGVEWLIDLPFEQVAELMAGSLAAYLPFPDHASYRRGSLLAALANGLPSLTTVGPGTPQDLVDVILPTSDHNEALAHLDWLYANPSEASAFGSAERLFAEKFSWTQIAREHKEVYRETLLRATPSS